MKRLTDLHHEVKNVQDTVLTDHDDEMTATGELMQQYDLDDMVEANVAELVGGLEDLVYLPSL